MTTFEKFQVAGIIIATVLSLVAIGTSVLVYRKQVAVSLFEKRLSAWVSLVNASEYFLQFGENLTANPSEWKSMVSRDKKAIIIFQSIFDDEVVSKVDAFWRLVIMFNVMVSEFSVQNEGQIQVPENMRSAVRKMCSNINHQRNELNNLLVERYFKKCT
jgi:hypothetical protein